METISNHVSEATTHHLAGLNHSIPSPFQLIPDDVLREILIACLDKSKTPTISTKTAPMLLTRISSHMRCVALQTPQLWTAVHMEFGHPGPVERDECCGAPAYKKWTKDLVARTRKQITELRRWLLFRSGVLPLSISIKERPQSHGRRGRGLAIDIMETLLTCYRRWQDISLDFHSVNLSMITALNDTDYPYLRSLRLQFYDCGDIPLHRSPLLRARNLADLVLTDCDISIANTMVTWANLTTIKFSRTLWEEYELEESGVHWIYDILQRTTRLVHCDIEVPFEFESPIGEISLPFLETLAINNGYESILPSEIPAYINAPALRRLESRNPDEHPGHLPALFARSRNIKELYVAYASARYLLEELRDCPSLETLRIYAMSESEHESHHTPFIEAFASDLEAARLCPNLVSFRCASPLAISVDVVRKLYGRMRGCGAEQGGWQDLTIESTDPIAAEEIKQLSMQIPTLEGIADVDDPNTW